MRRIDRRFEDCASNTLQSGVVHVGIERTGWRISQRCMIDLPGFQGNEAFANRPIGSTPLTDQGTAGLDPVIQFAREQL